jgi:hypothetical protein
MFQEDVDVSPQMLSKARDIDPKGDYRVIPDDDMTGLPRGSFSLVLSAFTFDNIPGHGHQDTPVWRLGRAVAGRRSDR